MTFTNSHFFSALSEIEDVRLFAAQFFLPVLAASWMKLFIVFNVEPGPPGFFHLLWKPVSDTFAYLISAHSHSFLTYAPELLRTVISVHLAYYPLLFEIKSLICR